MTEIDINVVKPERVVDIIVEPNLITVNVTVSGGDGGGAVDSVNAQTGAVVLDADDIAETSSRFWLTNVFKTAYDSAVSWINTNGASILSHIASTENPHGVTKSQVGLGNVDNTSDANKPISTAVALALALKANTATVTDISLTSTIVGFSSFTDRTIILVDYGNSVLCLFALSGISGTSLLTFTVNFTASNYAINQCRVRNNGAFLTNPGRAEISAGTSVVNVSLNNLSSSFAVGNAKSVYGQILILK
jgi:hypothetical protein